MGNENRLFAWLADVYRTGLESYVQFWCEFYGGVPTTRTTDLAHRTSRDAPEEALGKAP